MPKQNYTVFETFVGAGGSYLGFKEEKFKSVYVNDINKDCLKTLLYNNPNLQDENVYIDSSDISEISSRELYKKLKGINKGDVDVFFGGIVCKGFSLAGERSPNDIRNYLYRKQLELVQEFMPKISIIENVTALLNAKILSPNTPIEIKNKVDIVWKNLENYKGEKSSLRKKKYDNKRYRK